MRIVSVTPILPCKLRVELSNGRSGIFDLAPYLELESFQALSSPNEFCKIINGKYYVEWECCADLSIDTIEAHLQN